MAERDVFGAYVPVIHDGYIKAFDRNPTMPIAIFDESITDLEPYLRKDIRAMSPSASERCIRGLGREAYVISLSQLVESAHTTSYVMPDEDLTTTLQNNYPQLEIRKEPIFLRWDRNAASTNQDVQPDKIVRLSGNDNILVSISNLEDRSSNWWRRIGAIVNDRNGITILEAKNGSLPSEHSSWIDGDPRITANRGSNIEASIDIHAEASIISTAAKDGISLSGMDLFVSTFPCPNCAKLIALSGIANCYYVEGYAMIDGAETLRNGGVNIIKIEVETTVKHDPRSLKNYPEKPN